MGHSIPKKIAHGATWMLLFKLFDRGLGFVSTVVLARLLVPADFGLVAMAMSVIALIELAGAFSFEVALIQRKAPTPVHYDTTWTLRLLLGLFCAACTAALAFPTAAFYDDGRLAAVMLVLAVGWFVESWENIGTVDFRRELNFRREFVFLLSKRVVGVIVTLSIAISTRSYWALIAGTLAGRTVGVALSYVMHTYRPRFSLAVWRELMAFSGWLFATNVLWFVNSRLSHFVIGRVHGARSLGFFTVANDVAALASQEITMPINRAVMPGLSRLAEQQEGMASGLLKVITAISLIAFPASFGLMAVAEPLVLTLLGPKWTPAVAVVKILALAGALQSLTANAQSAYLASGKSHVPAISHTVLALCLVGLLVWLHRYGIVGIAWAQFGATVAAVCVSMAMMRRFLGVSLGAVFRAVARPFIASVVMGALVYALDLARFGLDEPAAVLRLILGVACGVLSYAALVVTLWWAWGRPEGVERMVFDRLARRKSA